MFDKILIANRGEIACCGYPVPIKAWMGGKGMRIVYDAKEFSAAVDSARREAVSSFGDGRVLVRISSSPLLQRQMLTRNRWRSTSSH